MLSGFLDLIQIGGLWLLFLLVFLEGNPIIGSFIPGQVLLVFIGFLISTTGIFDLWMTLFVVFLAAFLGDLLGFYLGKKLGVKGLEKFGLHKKSIIYRSSCGFFKKYGPWSIILGREFNFTRAFMPFFAGLFKMNNSKFFFLAFLSNLIWTILSVFLGYYGGYVVIDKLEFVFGFILFLIIYLVILYFIYRSFNKFLKQNSTLIKDYALHNIVYLGIILLSLVVLLFIYDWGFSRVINEQFAFLFMPNLGRLFAFLLSFEFLFGFVITLVLYLLFKVKYYRMIVILFWGFVISSFMTITFGIFLKKNFGFVPFASIIFLVLLIFFVDVLSRNFAPNKCIKYKIEVILIIILCFAVLAKFSITQDFFRILLSFFIAALECELIVILSHYNIVDRYLSDKVNSHK